jgi:SAM-dependent methyltransferase
MGRGMETATRACPLCGGPDKGRTFPFGTSWGGRTFEYFRCARCGSSFLDPVPTDEEFARMYDRSNYHDRYYETLSEEPAPTFLPELAPLLPPGGRLLDFGCGNGAFLRTAVAAGFRAEGVELEAKAREQAALNSGCEVLSIREARASGRRYDIVHLGDVLEHLPDPAQALRELEPLLAPAGLFFLEGPLEDNPGPVFYASRLFGAAKKALGRPLLSDFPPFHLFRTSAKAQRAFFENRMGYEVRAFLVDESGWPYLGGDDRLLRPGGAGKFLKILIGKTGVALARPARAVGVPMGNRFGAVLAARG